MVGLMIKVADMAGVAVSKSNLTWVGRPRCQMKLKPTAVIIRFVTRKIKNNVIRAIRTRHGLEPINDNNKICLSENLTPHFRDIYII